MGEIGKILIGIGAITVVVGLILFLVGKTPLGRLPGDFIVRRENFTFIFPVATCIIISVVLSVMMWLFFRFRR
jgi:ribose/xylose/arabinose/galactoside ABC-type transport system permease subunit